MDTCICGKEIDGSFVMVDVNMEPSHIPLCTECMDLWANHEFDELTKRIKR